MSAALAKHLTLPMQYQALIGDESWSRNGGLSFVNGHVNIAVAQPPGRPHQRVDATTLQQLNFGPSAGRPRPADAAGRASRTILAMFMNNRAAEALVRGDMANAYAYAREAVVQDPAFAAAYNTLGVIYQRRGLADAAERAYRHALARDDDAPRGDAQPGALLERQGRGDEAAPWRAKLARLEAEPPFKHFDLGRAAAQAGDFRSAREHILREMRRDPDYHEFHFWLAVALYGLGDVDAGPRAPDAGDEQQHHAARAGALCVQAAALSEPRLRDAVTPASAVEEDVELVAVQVAEVGGVEAVAADGAQARAPSSLPPSSSALACRRSTLSRDVTARPTITPLPTVAGWPS